MKDVDRDMVVLMAARASRLENQDAIDCAIVSMLDDPKEVSKHHSASYIYLLHCRFFTLTLYVVFLGEKKRRGPELQKFTSFRSIQLIRGQRLRT